MMMARSQNCGERAVRAADRTDPGGVIPFEWPDSTRTPPALVDIPPARQKAAPNSRAGRPQIQVEPGIMNPVKALENHGQAVWLDFLARGFVARGDLKKLIDTDGVKGVTSNPAIFEKAIGSSDEYDTPIGKALRAGDRPVADLFEQLAIEDIP